MFLDMSHDYLPGQLVPLTGAIHLLQLLLTLGLAGMGLNKPGCTCSTSTKIPRFSHDIGLTYSIPYVL